MARELCSNHIEIWDIDLNEQVCFKFEPYFHILSLEEKQKSDSFKVAWGKKVYILTYIILRLLLSNCIGIKPELIKLYKNKYGKPFIGSNKLNFNISHSKTKLVIALSAYEVGIDIEYIDPNFDVYEISDMVLSRNEKLVIEELEPDLQKKQFFLYWTQKEALLKAIGTGINSDLNILEVVPSSTIYDNSDKVYRFKEWNIVSCKNLNKNYVGHIAYRYNRYNNKKIIKHFNYNDLLHFSKIYTF
jgi:4'-phosphopantetheinyl transferase